MDTNKNSKKTELITSRQNPLITSLAKLGDKKYRDKEGLFLLDGIKLVLEAAANPFLSAECILVREDVYDVYCEQLSNAFPNTKIYMVGASAFEKITDEKSPQGVVAAVGYSESVKKNADILTLQKGTLLLLDGIQNPDNLGAMLRAARAFGMDGVVCGEGCADVYSRRVMRSSMGAALHIGTAYTNSLAELCEKLTAANRRVISAIPAEDADSLFDFEFRDSDVVVIGNEGHGVSDEVIEKSTDKLYIPMVKGQESLNAATAAAVIFYEIYRQKSLKFK